MFETPIQWALEVGDGRNDGVHIYILIPYFTLKCGLNMEMSLVDNAGVSVFVLKLVSSVLMGAFGVTACNVS